MDWGRNKFPSVTISTMSSLAMGYKHVNVNKRTTDDRRESGFGYIGTIAVYRKQREEEKIDEKKYEIGNNTSVA